MRRTRDSGRRAWRSRWRLAEGVARGLFTGHAPVRFVKGEEEAHERGMEFMARFLGCPAARLWQPLRLYMISAWMGCVRRHPNTVSLGNAIRPTFVYDDIQRGRSIDLVTGSTRMSDRMASEVVHRQTRSRERATSLLCPGLGRRMQMRIHVLGAALPSLENGYGGPKRRCG